MEEYTRALADFVRDHQAWAAPIVLLLAFGESLAFISLLIPAWGARGCQCRASRGYRCNLKKIGSLRPA